MPAFGKAFPLVLPCQCLVSVVLALFQWPAEPPEADSDPRVWVSERLVAKSIGGDGLCMFFACLIVTNDIEAVRVVDFHVVFARGKDSSGEPREPFQVGNHVAVRVETKELVECRFQDNE